MFGIFRKHGISDEERILKTAMAEWQTAVNRFENVSDPEMIDICIFDMLSARQKYMYLLKNSFGN